MEATKHTLAYTWMIHRQEQLLYINCRLGILTKSFGDGHLSRGTSSNVAQGSRIPVPIDEWGGLPNFLVEGEHFKRVCARTRVCIKEASQVFRQAIDLTLLAEWNHAFWMWGTRRIEDGSFTENEIEETECLLMSFNFPRGVFLNMKAPIFFRSTTSLKSPRNRAVELE